MSFIHWVLLVNWEHGAINALGPNWGASVLYIEILLALHTCLPFLEKLKLPQFLVFYFNNCNDIKKYFNAKLVPVTSLIYLKEIGAIPVSMGCTGRKHHKETRQESELRSIQLSQSQCVWTRVLLPAPWRLESLLWLVAWTLAPNSRLSQQRPKQCLVGMHGSKWRRQ